MSYEKMTCRVCGKAYEPCRSASKRANVFHWQEVACSPECGAVYLERINASRSGDVAAKKNKYKKRQSDISEASAEVAEEKVYDMSEYRAEDTGITAEIAGLDAE